MRKLSFFLHLLLAGCGNQTVYPSICDMPERFRGWAGAQVHFAALLEEGTTEGPPLIVDQRCWRGIAADITFAPAELRNALDTAGRFNKFATITGRITERDGQAWLRVTAVKNLRVEPPKTSDQEQAFFQTMVRQKNAYYHRSPDR